VKHILLHISDSWPITVRLVHSWAANFDVLFRTPRRRQMYVDVLPSMLKSLRVEFLFQSIISERKQETQRPPFFSTVPPYSLLRLFTLCASPFPGFSWTPSSSHVNVGICCACHSLIAIVSCVYVYVALLPSQARPCSSNLWDWESEPYKKKERKKNIALLWLLLLKYDEVRQNAPKKNRREDS